MKGNWPDEIVRLLENWALWIQNDKRPVNTIGIYPAYQLAARGPRAGNVIPILSVDAERTDKIITGMVLRYQQPLRMHYMWTVRSDRSRALACNCSVNTYKDRLNDAHVMFRQQWYAVSQPEQVTLSA